MKNYTKALVSLVVFASVFVAALFIAIPNSNAAKPADYGLKEGDLISAIFSDDPDVYIINDSGYKRLFLNPEIFKFYGHLGGFFNVKLVTTEVKDTFPTSGLFRNCENNDQKVYGVDIDGEDSGKLRWVNSSGEQAVKDDPDFFKKVFCINKKEFDWYPKGNAMGTVKDVPKYERVSEGKKVSHEEVTASSSFKEIGQAVICHYPPGNTLKPETLTVGVSAVKAHLAHGDTVGHCSVVSPTPTPTFTPTPTPILTPTPTAISTPTPSATPTPTPTLGDTTLPVISNVLVSNIRETSASISWTTNENATSLVEYGTSSGVLTLTQVATTVASGSIGYSNKTGLRNLSTSTSYYFRVKSIDSSGNTSYSTVSSFTPIPTSVPTPTPITAPITVTQPTSGRVLGNLNISFYYTSSGISKFGFKIFKGTQIVYEYPNYFSLTVPLSYPIGYTANLIVDSNNSYRIEFPCANLCFFPASSSGYRVMVFDWDHPEVYDYSDYFSYDTTKPTISSVSASAITTNSAVISWTTDEPAASEVHYYDLAAPTYGKGASNPVLVIEHSVLLSGLNSGANYSYDVFSPDALGNGLQTIRYFFTTLSN